MEKMNAIERVTKTLAKQETDRVPFDIFGTTTPNRERMMRYVGASTFEEMFKIIGIDIWYVPRPEYIGEPRIYKGLECSYFGVPHIARRGEGDSSKLSPLCEVSSVDEVEAYRMPKPEEFNPHNTIRAIEEHSEFALAGQLWAPLFHDFTWLCGFENALIFMHIQPDITEAILRRITDVWIEHAKMMLEAADGRILWVENCNDFGSQRGPLISLDQFRNFIKPQLKRLYETIKSYDVKVMQHCCGSITEFIPDLIEIGMDILNPIQVTAAGMEPQELKDRYGDRLVFNGGIDTQYILPNGTEEEVRKEVRRIIGIFGKNGGYILNGSQGLEDDIPIENIMAMFDEGRKIKPEFT